MKKQLLTSNSEHWCTPPELLDLIYKVAPVDLDPCSNLSSEVLSKKEFSLQQGQDGLTLSWQCEGLVFVNPPYGRKLSKWSEKIVSEAAEGSEIVALVPARTDTKWFQYMIHKANAACFLKGRVKFIDGVSGERRHPATFPSAVLYFGPNPDRFVTVFKNEGWTLLF